jgi:kojibiose phosphorylase
LESSKNKLAALPKSAWDELWNPHVHCWEENWNKSDVIVEGDNKAQLALRFNLYNLLIAASPNDEHVNIGAKTLSGYGYRGHSFWDTEIFILPFFTFTQPDIARNLLSYRYHNLAGAREKAKANGFIGAQFPWESAGSGREVTPTWVPNPNDPTKLIRIWTGDIQIHISADIAFAIWQYWCVTGDDDFMAERGAEIILDTARFWANRAEWNEEKEQYEFNNVIGPDENHDHVDNNAYTNYLVRWHLNLAVWLVEWLKAQEPVAATRLFAFIDLNENDIDQFKNIADKIYHPFDADTKLVEQFDGYFDRRYIDLKALEGRKESIQGILGIEETNQTQVLKQPDVIMLMGLLPDKFDQDVIRKNYQFYTERTDLSYGSSLGPSIQSIVASRLGKKDQAYDYFHQVAFTDIDNLRGNAEDGIHAASAGGLWQTVVFGFAGLRFDRESWSLNPQLPPTWKRLAFKFRWRGEEINVDLRPERNTEK